MQKLCFFVLCECKHNIKLTVLTIFKYTIQYHQAHSQYCTIITIIHFQNFLSSQTESLNLLNNNTHIRYALAPVNLYSVSIFMNLPMLGFSYKWNLKIFFIFCLAYFFHHNVYKAYPLCNISEFH